MKQSTKTIFWAAFIYAVSMFTGAAIGFYYFISTDHDPNTIYMKLFQSHCIAVWVGLTCALLMDKVLKLGANREIKDNK